MSICKKISLILILMMTFVYADSASTKIGEKLRNYLEELLLLQQDIREQQIEERSDSISLSEEILYDNASRWIIYLSFTIDLIEIHQAGQQVQPKQLYLVDKKIQECIDKIVEYFEIGIEWVAHYISIIDNPHLINRGHELVNTMKAVTATVDSLDLLSVYE